MGSYGQETFEIIGSGITVTADGAPIAKAAGVTVVWSAVPAVICRLWVHRAAVAHLA